MRTRTHTLLLLLLTLALAVAPVRGAWPAADAAAGSGDSAPHCEHMQHGTAPGTDTHAGHDTPANDAGPCSHDCGGSCCDGACNACVHATPPAIPGNITVLSGPAAGTPESTFSQLFPERPAIPLLQPPASSRS